ncbi:MAG: type I-Fv CRISPR-associated protein Cas5fv [Thiopseudomonas sp.]|nr:type I-Fv CRISPR-associated protein Cas5fv [Thiopseudomonas sp.]MCK9465243.1 type I-Fv CRISPR-associated protein Cas5fv [Thiopseudomonas sp.]
MKITIEYEASWRNSFLDGSNNEPLPKKGRKFVGSMTELRKPENYLRRSITKNTVMGILNRLIGEQAKLYQARERENYYFSEIEANLKESDIIDKPSITNEMVYIRNMSGSDDQNSFSGMLKTSSPAFSSSFSGVLWGVLWLGLDDLFNFITNSSYEVEPKQNIEPLIISERFEELNNKKLNKDLELDSSVQKVLDELSKEFPDVNYISNSGKIPVISLYCSALYLQIKRMRQYFDIDSILTKSGNLSGISKRGFTKKDFMSNHVTGGKKPVWGGAYLRKERVKGEGEVVSVLSKANGTLTINLDITRQQAIDLEEKIENAGVSSFYLGKKGLAYVTDIRI